MDVKEKLVELLKEVVAIQQCGFGDPRPTYETAARYLISNGVTVQEWIPVTERLPENNQWALCFIKDKSFGTFRVFQWNYVDWKWNDGNEWFDEKDVTHWMPLPLPPKGE